MCGQPLKEAGFVHFFYIPQKEDDFIGDVSFPLKLPGLPLSSHQRWPVHLPAPKAERFVRVNSLHNYLDLASEVRSRISCTKHALVSGAIWSCQKHTRASVGNGLLRRAVCLGMHEVFFWKIFDCHVMSNLPGNYFGCRIMVYWEC